MTSGSDELSVADLAGRREWDEINRVHRRPFVVYKFAATLDGRIAAADGTSQWISSAASRAQVHLLRAACHATIIGSGTQQADNPNLAVRGNDDPRLDLSKLQVESQPWRVVIDTNARTTVEANVLNDAAPTLIAVADDADTSHLQGKAEILRAPRAAIGLDVQFVLGALLDRGLPAVFLEGGPTLAGSFLRYRCIDRVISYIAPALLGAGKSALNDAGIRTIDDAVRLELLHVSQIGGDVRLISRPIQ